MFQFSLKNNEKNHYFILTDRGLCFAERVIRLINNLLKEPVFEIGNADSLTELPSVIEKYNNIIHSSKTTTPIQASKKMNEQEVYKLLQDKIRNLDFNFN